MSQNEQLKDVLVESSNAEAFRPMKSQAIFLLSLMDSKTHTTFLDPVESLSTRLMLMISSAQTSADHSCDIANIRQFKCDRSIVSVVGRN